MDSIDPYLLMDSARRPRPPSPSPCNNSDHDSRSTTTTTTTTYTSQNSTTTDPLSPSLLIPNLTVKIPSPHRLQKDPISTGSGQETEAAAAEGYTTPTSSDRRIPAVPVLCPPAPRKPKPNTAFKRARTGRRRIALMDISNQINQFLFPPHIKDSITSSSTDDDADHGNNVIKKIRTD